MYSSIFSKRRLQYCADEREYFIKISMNHDKIIILCNHRPYYYIAQEVFFHVPLVLVCIMNQSHIIPLMAKNKTNKKYQWIYLKMTRQ